MWEETLLSIQYTLLKAFFSQKSHQGKIIKGVLKGFEYWFLTKIFLGFLDYKRTRWTKMCVNRVSLNWNQWLTQYWRWWGRGESAPLQSSWIEEHFGGAELPQGPRLRLGRRTQCLQAKQEKPNVSSATNLTPHFDYGWFFFALSLPTSNHIRKIFNMSFLMLLDLCYCVPLPSRVCQSY